MIGLDLDEGVHQKIRLGVLVILSEVPKAEFNYLKETLGATAGNLQSPFPSQASRRRLGR